MCYSRQFLIPPQALKLAERTIQFADTLTVLTEGYLRAGRVSHTEGSLGEATKHYTAAAAGQPKHVLAAIGLAQLQMQNGNFSFTHLVWFLISSVR